MFLALHAHTVALVSVLAIARCMGSGRWPCEPQQPYIQLVHIPALLQLPAQGVSV